MGPPGPHRGSRGVVAGLVAITLLGGAPAASASGGGTVAGHVRASPLLVSLELSATSVAAGQTLQARATVSNVGPSLLRRIVVELRFDPVGLRTTKAVTEVAQLKAGKSAAVSWSVCGRLPGTYVLLARVTLDGASIDSSARLLTITAGGKKTCG